jgi:hypothetical protein
MTAGTQGAACPAGAVETSLHGQLSARPHGNPDGKGAIGLLADWQRSNPEGVVAKPKRQLLAEFFTSMLVLSASFRYRPVRGRPNYLYWIDGEWSLSLIAPDQWSDARRTGFVGVCVLQRDMTWTIAPSGLLGQQGPLSDALRGSFEAFAEMLDTDLTLEEILPYHVGRLPYYPRIYANALGRSLRSAVRLDDQAGINCRQWSKELPRMNGELPGCILPAGILHREPSGS